MRPRVCKNFISQKLKAPAKQAQLSWSFFAPFIVYTFNGQKAQIVYLRTYRKIHVYNLHLLFRWIIIKITVAIFLVL